MCGGGEKPGQDGRRSGEMLEIVERQQQVLASQMRQEAVDCRLTASLVQ